METDMRELNRAVIAEYRRSGAPPSGPMEDMPILLLTTTGRRSGRPRTTPLGFVDDSGRLVVAASSGGAPIDPDWFRNLVAWPEVTVELGRVKRRATAQVIDGAEHERLFALLASTLPGMAEYAGRAGRRIPVVALSESPGR